MTVSSTHSNHGFFVPLPSSPKRTEEEYMERIRRDVEAIQQHPLFEELPQVSTNPCTAVVVGTGTVGLQAIVLAVRCLPRDSTIMVVQRGVEHPAALINTLQTSIRDAEAYNFVVSPPVDIGQLDEIEAFLDRHQNTCQATRLFIHTADSAQRHIPDALPIQEVLSQIVRRASPCVISDKLDELSDGNQPIVKILISSECAQDRSRYRIPNLGPYQVGKIVGDELFRTHNDGNERAISIIAYSGPMATTGQDAARRQEYVLSAEVRKEADTVETYLKQCREGCDMDPMDSTGMMLKEVAQALHDGQLQRGKVYSIYGPSVNPMLAQTIGKIEEIATAPYLWPPRKT